MSRKITLSVITAIILGLCIETIYANLKLRNETSAKTTLDAKIKMLEEQSEKLKSALEEKEKILKELSNVQAISEALSKAQVTAGELNKKLERLNIEKMALQEMNQDMTTRLANTTKELMHALEDLKNAKTNVSGTDFDKRTSELQAENSDLKMKLIALQNEAYNQSGPMQNLQEDINKLRETISQKETQIARLEAQLKGANLSVPDWEDKISRQQDIIKDLESSNRNLTAEIARMKSVKEGEAGTSALYESAKEQIRKLSDIVVKKEMEADKAKKETEESKGKVGNLQGKISDLENRLAAKDSGKDKVRELEEQRAALQLRLDEAQGELARKRASSDSLQKEADALRQKLSEKEEDQKAIEDKLSQLESATTQMQRELTRKKSGEEANETLYNAIKAKVSELSDTLARKELEIQERQKEIASLKEEALSLKSRSAKFEEELTASRERQKKTIEDLSAAVKLNSALQESMLEASQSLEGSASAEVPQDKQKAIELKRKIEVILAPEK
ncbi:MAG: hypothetical protein ACM3IL_00075 [Deltaproteobacteria bacterium]